MRIEIETDGSGARTQIVINGKKQEKLKEFNISVNAKRSVKLQMIQEINGEDKYMSFYSDDFKKIDECSNKIDSKGE